MKISLAPIAYYWSEEDIRTFYRQVAETPVDIVYLGETICSKRRSLNSDQWIEIAQELAQAGKTVVLSTMVLLEAESELKTLRRICSNGEFLVEANDLAAVNRCSEASIPFVAGHALNLYNSTAIARLAKSGMVRWQLPVELSEDTLQQLHQQRPDGVETEVQVWGKLPLAYAARCYTARHYNLPKDDCQYRCLDDPDGMMMRTKEGQSFLTINGIQTQSAQYSNLVGVLDEINTMGVEVIRVAPHLRFTPKILQLLDRVRQGELSPEQGKLEIDKLYPEPSVDGYWYGEAGIQQHQALLDE
ncbi:MAG: U32 family peptidase [Gammaproteobacteria bacterium]|nr:U32 family peptidase [Gammaproteobacteria bacterium]MBT4608196.1 U32 family peptidase [Thiotrichales bacterium]MBT3472200.1 U32 family peptidase [Gammaproteobacteria bacterium]MBT3965997.1 U32 family peptidase [Gammaproteobacteria bacterium]MBT4079921.1 U32 family peptidase [Gammaproteobacteria bacterium]